MFWRGVSKVKSFPGSKNQHIYCSGNASVCSLCLFCPFGSFDFGFWEIAIIGVITLIVVGPEKMPSLARKAGLYFGRFKKFLNKIKSDINEELKMDETRADYEIQITNQQGDLVATFKGTVHRTNKEWK